MDETTCSVEGCERPPRKNRLRICHTHAERLRIHGSLDLPKPKPRGKKAPGFTPLHPVVCTVDDCGRKSFLRGWCKAHYERWRKGDEPIGEIRSFEYHAGESCAADGCDRARRIREWCRAHYQMWRLTGVVPDGPVQPRSPRLPVVNYFSLHQRLEKDLGKAAGYQCVDCSRQAQDWSYDNSDPDELICSRSGLAYSLDEDRYLPRCRSCHAKFDGAGQHLHAH